MVLLSDERTSRVPVPLLGVQLPGWLRKSLVPLLHGHGGSVHAETPLGRPAVHLPAGPGADPEPELALAHEPLAGRAHERNRLGEKDSHRVP